MGSVVQLLLLSFTGRHDLSQGTDHEQSVPSSIWGRSGVIIPQILCQAPELGYRGLKLGEAKHGEQRVYRGGDCACHAIPQMKGTHLSSFLAQPPT